MRPGHETFEHGADVGIRGIGRDLEEAFINAAKALFTIMVYNLEEIRPKKRKELYAEGDSLEELFLDWLNVLLSEAGMENIIFSEFGCRIQRHKGDFKLFGWAAGEGVDDTRHELGQEVKGATYTMLKVEKTDGLWLAQCVVDV